MSKMNRITESLYRVSGVKLNEDVRFPKGFYTDDNEIVDASTDETVGEILEDATIILYKNDYPKRTIINFARWSDDQCGSGSVYYIPGRRLYDDWYNENNLLYEI